MKLRRRHFVLLAVVLLIGAPIAWRYRPLNELERRLVGVWVRVSKPGMSWDGMELKSDRSANFWISKGGSWSASGDQIFLRTPSYDYRGLPLWATVDHYAHKFGLASTTKSHSIRFLGHDFLGQERIVIGGEIFERSSERWKELTHDTSDDE